MTQDYSWHLHGNDEFWPIVGQDEGQTIVGLLDQSFSRDDDDDTIHPPSLVTGTLDSEFLDNDEEGFPIHAWLLRTLDGVYDLYSTIVVWRFLKPEEM